MFRRSLTAFLAIAALAPGVRAQDSTAAHAQDSTAQDSTALHRSGRILTNNDLAVIGTFAAASVALSAFDPRIAKWWQRPALQQNSSLSNAAGQWTHLNETPLTLGALGVYGISSLAHWQAARDISFHVAEAIVISSVAAQVIRGPLGRARPDVVNFEDQYDFKAFSGFGDFKRRSFPSIHSAAGFAFATVIIAETNRRHPKANWIVAPVVATIGIIPPTTRLYLGKHWASDILMGAFMGTFTGLKVVQYSHTHPRNRIDRIFLGAANSGVSVTPAPGGGMAVGFTRSF